MTDSTDLFKYQALLLPWNVRGLKTLFTESGSAWHDGDTFNAFVDLGLRGYQMIHIRPAGYDAPEVYGATKDAGLVAAAFARTLAEVGDVVYIDSIDFAAANEEDDFARMLGFVTLPDGRDLAQVMVESGNAVPDPA